MTSSRGQRSQYEVYRKRFAVGTDHIHLEYELQTIRNTFETVDLHNAVFQKRPTAH